MPRKRIVYVTFPSETLFSVMVCGVPTVMVLFVAVEGWLFWQRRHALAQRGHDVVGAVGVLAPPSSSSCTSARCDRIRGIASSSTFVPSTLTDW